MAKQIDILCSESSLYNAWTIVKAKGAAGGIDGITIQEFEKEKRKQIPLLADELKSGTWKPYPYLEIEIPKSKDQTEKRKLAMIAIRDKIVQQAIRAIIEPRHQVVKLMESIGTRMNYSVFECMLTDIQYQNMCKRLTKLIYPLCIECYARIEYIPPIKKKEPVKIVVV